MDEENHVSLRERIRLNLLDAMENANITQVQLAEKLGTSKGTVNNWTRGNNSPDVDMVPKICAVLGIPILSLYEPRNSEPGEALPRGKKAPSLSDEAKKLAKDYDSLDHWGRTAVRGLADTELARMEDEIRFFSESNLKPEPKVINLFDNPSAAGPALGETGQGCRPYELGPDDPQGASYAIRVQGDSMEPDFPDGSIAFVNHDEMRDGDIGVFCVDGATVIKQYHYDAFMGMAYLFSLNRKRRDADLLITKTGGRSLVWQGRVITKKRYPVPGM